MIKLCHALPWRIGLDYEVGNHDNTIVISKEWKFYLLCK